MRELADGVLHLLESAVKPGLQLRQRHMRHMPIVKEREWQAKLGAELGEGQFGALGLNQHVVGRLPHRRQVIY